MIGARRRINCTSPAYTVINPAEAFHTQISRPIEMWQTDFTYFKIIG
jgi:putative transposase